MSNKINNVWQILRNHKYLWTLLAFILIAGFLDENSFLKFYQLRKQNKAIKKELTMYENEYKNVTAELQRLKKSPNAYEEVARVRLFMKSDDEDVYVIETENQQE